MFYSINFTIYLIWMHPKKIRFNINQTNLRNSLDLITANPFSWMKFRNFSDKSNLKIKQKNCFWIRGDETNGFAVEPAQPLPSCTETRQNKTEKICSSFKIENSKWSNSGRAIKSLETEIKKLIKYEEFAVSPAFGSRYEYWPIGCYQKLIFHCFLISGLDWGDAEAPVPHQPWVRKRSQILVPERSVS